jgi:hypothetical protein
MQNEYDDWNRARKQFNEYLMQTITSIHPWEGAFSLLRPGVKRGSINIIGQR